jgi:hypothetical protein
MEALILRSQKHGFSIICQRHETGIQKLKIGDPMPPQGDQNHSLIMFLIRAPEGITEKGGAIRVTFQFVFWTIV